MDASRQSTPPTHSSQPRQRPEIPSIGKLSSWSAPRSSFSAPSFNLQPTTPISQTEQYYVPSFGGGASQLGSSLPSMVPSFMHPSEVEEPAYSSQARWLTPEPEPRTPAFGPATSNRRRSASTGALPSTYSTSPYSIPATVPGPDFISQEEERLRVIDQTRSLWDLQDASEG